MHHLLQTKKDARAMKRRKKQRNKKATGSRIEPKELPLSDNRLDSLRKTRYNYIHNRLKTERKSGLIYQTTRRILDTFLGKENLEFSGLRVSL